MTHHFTRRQFIKHAALFTGAAASLPLVPAFAADTNSPAAAPPGVGLFTVDASARQ